jgi:hypothetical protein
MPTGKKQLVNESEKVSFADRPGHYGLGTIQSHLGLPPERAPKSSQLPSGRSAVPGPPTGRFPPAPAQLTHPTAGHQGVHRESQPVLVAEPGAGRRAAQVRRGGRLRRGDRGGPLAGHSSISLSPSERHHGRASSVMVTGGVTRWSSGSTCNRHPPDRLAGFCVSRNLYCILCKRLLRRRCCRCCDPDCRLRC